MTSLILLNYDVFYSMFNIAGSFGKVNYFWLKKLEMMEYMKKDFICLKGR